MARTTSDLPFGSELSPSQIDLATVLRLAKKHEGDWQGFEDAVRALYFEAHDTTDDYNRKKLANNCRLSLGAYGLTTQDLSDFKLTEVGEELLAIADDEEALLARFAKHILLNLNGYNLVTCILDMQSGGMTVNLVTLREELDRRGVHFPRGGKHPSIVRLWLEKAGVFTSGYRVNEAMLEDLMGMTKPEIEALVTLTTQQSAFLRAFASIGADDVPSNEIEILAREAYGVTFNEKSLPKDVLYPLEKAGYITLKRGTQGGRGAKPFLVSRTNKLVTDVIEPLLEQFSSLLNPELIPYLRKSIHDILEDLDTDDRHIKGVALEAFAMKVIQLLGLEVTSIRLRGVDTGGAEVDVVAEREDITFRRWQVQCKNTATVRLEDIAKEVGVAAVTKANTIVIMTTGSVTEDGKRYTDKVIQDTNLFIAVVDGADVRAIADNPIAIVAILRREARRAARLRQAGNQTKD